MTYGLTEDGFVAKTLEAILAEIEAELRGAFGDDVNTSSASVFGQYNGIVSTKLRELWELAQAVSAGAYPDSAGGRSLSMLAALTGTTRRPATFSLVLASPNLDPGTYAPGTLIASVIGAPDRRFRNRFVVVNDGVSAAAIPAYFLAEEAGVVLANAGTLSVIAQAVPGWNSIVNATDAVAGKLEESDAELRVRREQELAAVGSTTVDAIRADILQKVTGVISATVLENDTDTTNGDGVPPHSVEAIVRGPEPYTDDDDQAVADQIWKTKAGGVRAYGSTTKSVIDSQGRSHAVGFTRPTDRNVYLEIDLTVDADTYVGDPAVETALVTWANANLASDDDVIAMRLAAVALGLEGVEDVTGLRLGFTVSPVGTTNLAIALREIAKLDTGRIEVAS